MKKVIKNFLGIGEKGIGVAFFVNIGCGLFALIVLLAVAYPPLFTDINNSDKDSSYRLPNSNPDSLVD